MGECSEVIPEGKAPFLLQVVFRFSNQVYVQAYHGSSVRTILFSSSKALSPQQWLALDLFESKRHTWANRDFRWQVNFSLKSHLLPPNYHIISNCKWQAHTNLVQNFKLKYQFITSNNWWKRDYLGIQQKDQSLLTLWLMGGSILLFIQHLWGLLLGWPAIKLSTFAHSFGFANKEYYIPVPQLQILQRPIHVC